MIPGVSSSNQRVVPWATRYTRQPGNTATNTKLSTAYVDGSTVYFRDNTDADIMSGSDVNATFTDQTTAGIDAGGWLKFSNSRWFVRNGTGATMATMTSLGGTITTVSKDIRDVLWIPQASLWLAVGDDGAGNCLQTTSTNGTTWTDRADIFTADRGTGVATDGTRTNVIGNNNHLWTTTSTTAPFTWSRITTTGFSAADDPKWINYIPEKSLWLMTNDNNDLLSYSSNGTTWAVTDMNMNMSGNAGPVNVLWMPSLNRWIAISAGNSTSTSGRGQFINISDTDSVTGTWSVVLDDSQVDWFTGVALATIHTFNLNNRYLISAGTNNRMFYTRAG